MQVDNLKGLLGVRRMDRVPNAWIRELGGVAKGVDESVFHWFRHIEKMENDTIANRVYVGECVDSRLVGRPRKRWIDSANGLFEEKKFKYWSSKTMVYDANE